MTPGPGLVTRAPTISSCLLSALWPSHPTPCPWQASAALCASMSPPSPRKHSLTAPPEAPSHSPRAPAPSAGSPREPVLMGEPSLPAPRSSVPESCLSPGRPGPRPRPFYRWETEAGRHWPKVTERSMSGRALPRFAPSELARMSVSLSALSPGSRPGPSHWLTKRRRSRPPPAQASWGSWPGTSPCPGWRAACQCPPCQDQVRAPEPPSSPRLPQKTCFRDSAKSHRWGREREQTLGPLGLLLPLRVPFPEASPSLPLSTPAMCQPRRLLMPRAACPLAAVSP